MRFVALVALVLAGCHITPPGVKGAIDRAGEVMEESPDSALSILRGVDTTRIYDRKIRNRFYLLRGQATARSGRSVVPLAASLKDAAEFYKFSPDKRSDMLAQYYYGCVIEGDPDAFTEALYRHIRAKALAEELRDTLYMAATASSLYNVYASVGYYSDALAQARSSHRLFQALPGYETASASASLDILNAHHGLNEDDSIIAKLPSVEREVIISGNDNLRTPLMLLQAKALFGQEKYSEALPLYESIVKHPAYAGRYKAERAAGYIQLNELSTAKKLLDSIPEGQGEILRTSSYVYYFEKSGDASNALLYSEKCREALSDHVNANTRQQYASTIQSLMSEDHAHHNDIIQDQRLLYGGGGFLLLVILVFTAGWFHYFRKNKTLERLSQMETVNQLTTQLKEASQSNYVLSRSLVRKDYDLANAYFQELYYSGVNDASKLRAVKEVGKKFSEYAVSSIDKPRMIERLNESADNLYDDFVKDMNNLKEEDYDLFLFSSYGFSNAAISVILDVEDVSSVYSRRKRLRKKIKDGGFTRGEEYLTELNSSSL